MKILGNELERTVAIVPELSFPVVLGNDFIEKYQIYTKPWLTPPKAFSDSSGVSQKMLTKEQRFSVCDLLVDQLGYGT